MFSVSHSELFYYIVSVLLVKVNLSLIVILNNN